MNVRTIQLENVRQFENATFHFQPGFNLLVGENGSGKTTVLRSLLATAGSRKHSGGGNLGFETSDIKLGADQLHAITVVDDKNGDKRRLVYTLREGEKNWRDGKKSDLILLYYRSNAALTGNLRSKKVRKTQLPTASESSDAEEFLYRTERQLNYDIKPEERFGRSREIKAFVADVLSKMSDRFQQFSWRFEAYDCSVRTLNETKNAKKDQEHRVRKTLSDLLLRSFQLNPKILADVDQRTITINSEGYIVGLDDQDRVSPPFIQLLRIELGQDEVKSMGVVESYIAEVKLTPRIVVNIPEGDLPLSQLSDGEQRLFSLFVDIARVLFLNTADSISESPAVVLIDEIDVHLHPKWQRQIIPFLEDLFPSCQFIATTHSPFVIQSVGRQKVQKATEKGSFTFSGEAITIEDIVEDIQDIDMPQRGRRAEQLSKAAEHYFSLLAQESADSGELGKAEHAYRLASEPFTSNPAVHALLKVEKLQSRIQ